MKKHMVKAIVISGGLFFSTSSFSQTSFGLKAGASFSALQLKYSDGTKAPGANIVPGLNAGMTVEFPVWENIYIQPGLLFTMKGAKLTKDAYYWFNQQTPGESDYTTLKANYIELPVNAIYKYPLGKGKAIGGIGPYVAYGIGGKWKDVRDGQVEKGKLKFEKYYDDLPEGGNYYNYGRKLDIGLNVLLGYELTQNLSAIINGGFGLKNVKQINSGNRENDARQNNIGVSLSVGYKF